MKKPVPRRLTLSVVGMQYRVTKTTRQMISEHVEKDGPLECKLVRESSNKHDPNAIRVLISDKPYTGLFIGYLTRQVAEILAAYLDSARVTIGKCLLVSVAPRDGEGEIRVTLKTRVNFPAHKLISSG